VRGFLGRLYACTRLLDDFPIRFLRGFLVFVPLFYDAVCLQDFWAVVGSGKTIAELKDN